MLKFVRVTIVLCGLIAYVLTLKEVDP
jgi:hypothetical protein